jgi:Kef-type K+ transport system membrane component KefB
VTAAALAAFMAVRACGENLRTTDATSPEIGSGLKTSPDTLLHVLLALVLVILVARVTAMALGRLRQPPVIGEILAGIMLGPSLLGRIAPAESKFLFPPDIIPLLGVLSQIGIIIYMFLVGLKLDTRELRQRKTTSIAVSHASIVAPFLLGAVLALWLYPRFSSNNVPFTVFALFIGVSMSVTAFPVLARILTDRGINNTRLGTIALACAAVDDVTAWCLLALLVGTVHAAPGDALITLGLTVGFIVVMIFVVRPAALLLKTVRDNRGELTQGMFLVICVGILLAAVATERIGIHALFGAFALGALIPHDSALVRDVTAKLEDVVIVVLLPSFFALTGMRTELGLVTGGEAIFACVLIIVVASVGKFGGSALAAVATGLGGRDSLALGVLMNTRGLMELIVLNVGLELGVVSPTLFTMLVIMALVTTLATTPILDRLRDRAVQAPDRTLTRIDPDRP